MGLYNFSFYDSCIDQDIALEQFRGKAVMIVNTASYCGFTPQFVELQKLWEKYQKAAFILIGTPCNDFGQQDPKNNQEIREFCEANFHVDFIMTDKVHISGQEAHPFYKWLHSKTSFLSKPRWNFYKYLFDKNGHLASWYYPFTSPLSPKIQDKIERFL